MSENRGQGSASQSPWPPQNAQGSPLEKGSLLLAGDSGKPACPRGEPSDRSSAVSPPQRQGTRFREPRRTFRAETSLATPPTKPPHQDAGTSSRSSRPRPLGHTLLGDDDVREAVVVIESVLAEPKEALSSSCPEAVDAAAAFYSTLDLASPAHLGTFFDRNVAWFGRLELNVASFALQGVLPLLQDYQESQRRSTSLEQRTLELLRLNPSWKDVGIAAVDSTTLSKARGYARHGG